jgi:uncharacterized coiled-coil protein SlyX
MEMSEISSIEALEERLNKIEQHVAEQDTEIYRLSKRVDVLLTAFQTQKLQLEALAEGGAGGSMPADEKPPHY